MILDRTRRSRHHARARAAALLFAVVVPLPAAAQQPAAQQPAAQQPAAAPVAQTGRALALDDAIRIAARESEALRIARAGVNRAT
jgi:hypothetical protein